MRTPLLLLALFCFSIAQSQTDTTQHLKEVVVSSHRHPSTLEQVARQVTVIDRAEIEQAPVQSLSELLEFVMSVDIRQRGQFGVQSDVSIRGGTFDQTLILINGIKMTDPQTGHHSMNLPVDLNQIERIEVLHGGASRVFGPNAFAGAINIITRTRGENQVGAELMAGQHGLFGAGAHITLNTGNWNHSFSYNRRGSDGFMRNTDFIWNNAFLQSAAHLKNHEIIINAGYNQKAFGASTFYSAFFPNQFEETSTRFVSVSDKMQLHENLSLSVRGYYREHRDRFELFREGDGFYRRTDDNFFVMGNDTAPSWYQGHNYHRTESWGLEADASYKWKAGVTTVGIEYRSEQIQSNVLGQPVDNPVSVSGEHPSAMFTRADGRENLSIYAEHNLNFKNLFVSAGMLYNMNTAFEDEVFPGIDVAYQLGQHFRPYASWNRSVRFPTFTDLYYNLGGAVGSIDLTPESSVNYEGGLKYFGKHVSGVATFFRREGVNLIDWIRFEGSDITQAANITTLNINGLELGFQANLKALLGEKSPFSSLRIGYTYMQGDSASTGFESNYALDFLQHQFNAVLLQQISEKISVQWNTSFQQRLGGYFDPSLGEEVPFEPVLLLDVRISHRTEMFDVFLEVANLFDRLYVDIGNVPQPGRWLRAGVAIRLGY